MAVSSDIHKLDTAIAALESKLAAFRALREALANADAAEEVRRFFADSNGSVPVKKRQRKSTLMDKIASFFSSTHNEWATIEEIGAGTHLKKEAIRQIIYKGHVSRFERDTKQGGNVPGKYRLKT